VFYNANGFAADTRPCMDFVVAGAAEYKQVATLRFSASDKRPDKMDFEL
jgi:hypothetical protein